MMDFKELIEAAKEAAVEAGKVIIDIYESGDFSIEAKADNFGIFLFRICKNIPCGAIRCSSEEGFTNGAPYARY